MKYNEKEILDEISDYISNTYGAHYSQSDGVQTLDLIDAIGDAEAFCRSNILKYASRYDKKGTAKKTSSKLFTTQYYFYISQQIYIMSKVTLSKKH